MEMILGLWIVAAWMGFVSAFGIATLGWAVYSGQLDDLEDTKYIPFNEREPEAWPGRKSAAKGV
jgi:nitrogen fixation-related uncharacterized protein